jgi:hypothetical protein
LHAERVATGHEVLEADGALRVRDAGVARVRPLEELARLPVAPGVVRRPVALDVLDARSGDRGPGGVDGPDGHGRATEEAELHRGLGEAAPERTEAARRRVAGRFDVDPRTRAGIGADPRLARASVAVPASLSATDAPGTTRAPVIGRPVSASSTRIRIAGSGVSSRSPTARAYPGRISRTSASAGE